MLNWGLGYVIGLTAQLHPKFVEIHRRSMNRLLRTRKRARAWIIFQSLVRRSVESIRCRAEKVSH